MKFWQARRRHTLQKCTRALWQPSQSRVRDLSRRIHGTTSANTSLGLGSVPVERTLNVRRWTRYEFFGVRDVRAGRRRRTGGEATDQPAIRARQGNKGFVFYDSRACGSPELQGALPVDECKTGSSTSNMSCLRASAKNVAQHLSYAYQWPQLIFFFFSSQS